MNSSKKDGARAYKSNKSLSAIRRLHQMRILNIQIMFDFLQFDSRFNTMDAFASAFNSISLEVMLLFGFSAYMIDRIRMSFVPFYALN